MLDMLASIGEAIRVFVDFIVSMVSNLMTIISIIPDSIAAINYSIGYMPSVLAVFAFAGIGICVVFHIVGR